MGGRHKTGGRNLLPTMLCNSKANKICLNQHAEFLRFYFKKAFFLKKKKKKEIGTNAQVTFL